MAQTRKKAILQQVQRQRRNRTIASLVVAVVLIAVIVTAAAFLAPKTSLVPLPGYLDQCATSATAYHAHPYLTINISGTPMVIPGGVGIEGGCNRPLHTHSIDGVIHIETAEQRDYSLGDFLMIWGNWANDRSLTILNSTQVFNNHGHVTMTVNGAPPPLSVPGDMKSYLFPRNAGTNGNPVPCSALSTNPPGTCVLTKVLITYTPGPSY